MQAFIAVLLIAAVSGQMTTGVERNLVDLLRLRQTVYPQTWTRQEIMDQLLNTRINKFNPLTTTKTGVYGDLDLTSVIDQFVPTTQDVKIFSIPSDMTLYTYTLRQLYQLPIFQEYMTLPLFRQYINTPAFQLYLVSADFQKFFLQPVFRQFFVEPVLFVKFVLPVVQEYQKYVQIYTNQHEVNMIKPVTTTTTIGQNFPVVRNNIYTNFLYKNLMNKNFVLPQMYNRMYNNQETFLNKEIVPEVYGQQTMYNKMYNNVFPQIYNNEQQVVYNKDFLPQTVFGQQEQTMIKKNILDILFGGEKIQKVNQFYPTTVKTTSDLYLEKIVKDLIEGKIDINDLKNNINMNMNTQFLNEKIVQKKIVDPITGEVKIVDEKIVKPVVDTILVDGVEYNKDAVLMKKILNKNIFNKL